MLIDEDVGIRPASLDHRRKSRSTLINWQQLPLLELPHRFRGAPPVVHHHEAWLPWLLLQVYDRKEVLGYALFVHSRIQYLQIMHHKWHLPALYPLVWLAGFGHSPLLLIKLLWLRTSLHPSHNFHHWATVPRFLLQFGMRHMPLWGKAAQALLAHDARLRIIHPLHLVRCVESG